MSLLVRSECKLCNPFRPTHHLFVHLLFATTWALRIPGLRRRARQKHFLLSKVWQAKREPSLSLQTAGLSRKSLQNSSKTMLRGVRRDNFQVLSGLHAGWVSVGCCSGLTFCYLSLHSREKFLQCFCCAVFGGETPASTHVTSSNSDNDLLLTNISILSRATTIDTNNI